jgi:glyoxylase-like metal-dependent hydrolase (beta-lactamase superfamily II)
MKSGKLKDGKPFTAADKKRMENSIKETAEFAAEVRAVPRVLPNLVYRDTMIFWSGNREFRLSSETGDATASTVLYLPAEGVLVTGDVLVSPESGKGTPPWTMNSYDVSKWLKSLRRLDALDAKVIVPGQGPAMHNETYLKLTIEMYESVIAQVKAALARGIVRYEAVKGAVNVDAIGRRYMPGSALGPYFHEWVADIVKRAHQEALDGRVQ